MIKTLEEFNRRYLPETEEEKRTREEEGLTPEELGEKWARELLARFGCEPS